MTQTAVRMAGSEINALRDAGLTELEINLRRNAVEGTTAYMGKCPEKGCKTGVRLNLPSFYELPPERLSHSIDGKHVGSGAVISENNICTYNVAPMCIKHQTFLRFTGLKATHNTSACDDICANATGSICKCSCGGSNHGIR